MATTEEIIGKRIYTVSLTTVVAVAAKDAGEAEAVARKNMRDILRNTSLADMDVEAVNGIPAGWDDAYPYGIEGDITCQQVEANHPKT